ncbi:MAG: hypothetical protein ACI8PQ_002639, partial [Planctomycetota bacterium]
MLRSSLPGLGRAFPRVVAGNRHSQVGPCRGRRSKGDFFPSLSHGEQPSARHLRMSRLQLMIRHTNRVVLLSLPLFLGACGGGGSSSGETVGLEPPGELNLVEPVGESSLEGDPTIGGLNLPETSDYVTDTARTNVYDPAIESLQTLNSILCYLDLAGSNLLVNEPPFLSQIDPSLCEEGQDGDSLGSEDGQSSGATSFELWTVESTRASNSVSQVSKLWVPRENETGGMGPEIEIRVQVEIEEGASDDNPFGQWGMSFAGAITANSTIVDPPFYGVIQTVDTTGGDIGFTFYEASGDVDMAPAVGEDAYRTQVNVRVNASQTSGYARIYVANRYNDGVDSGLINSEFLVAFDSTHFLRSTDGGTPVLYSRTDFAERVWQYNLYYATGVNAGDRVELESGFGFRTAGGDYGYAGYYGVWLPDDATISSGDTV